jgi:hypothetical protein
MQLSGLTRPVVYLNDNQISDVTPLSGLGFYLGKQRISGLPIGPKTDTEWQKAYEKVLDGYNAKDKIYRNGCTVAYGVQTVAGREGGESYYGFSLVDFDDDGIPELVVHIARYEDVMDEIYSYKDGNIYYSSGPSGLFMEISTNYYIGYDDYDKYWMGAYKFENGELTFIEDYADVAYPAWDGSLDYDEYEKLATIHIGDAVYPLDDFYIIKGKAGFKSVDYSCSRDFETALAVYLGQTN